MMNPVRPVKQFYHETMQEVKKCTWPSRPELFEATVLVLVALAFLTITVFVTDNILHYAIRWVLGISGS